MVIGPSTISRLVTEIERTLAALFPAPAPARIGSDGVDGKRR